MEIQTILVVVDPTKQNQPIIARAVRIARAYDAALELMVAERYPGADDGNLKGTMLVDGKTGYSEFRKAWLEKHAETVRVAGVAVSTHFCWSNSLYVAVIDRSLKINADLIMKATHHHSVLQRALFTHTDWHLIRESAANLWLVKEEHIWEGHIGLMAAIDPVIEQRKDVGIASKILALAYDLSCRLPAELGVLNAYEPIPLGMLAGAGRKQDDYRSYRSRIRDEHDAALQEVLKDFAPVNFNVHLDEGAADVVIAEIAQRESIDVMLIGTVSHSRMDRILVGSTAERVLEKINCDVLVVK